MSHQKSIVHRFLTQKVVLYVKISTNVPISIIQSSHDLQRSIVRIFIRFFS